MAHARAGHLGARAAPVKLPAMVGALHVAVDDLAQWGRCAHLGTAPTARRTSQRAPSCPAPASARKPHSSHKDPQTMISTRYRP
eukprot:1145880-Pelagomonas_calceolata.AAC.3